MQLQRLACCPAVMAGGRRGAERHPTRRCGVARLYRCGAYVVDFEEKITLIRIEALMEGRCAPRQLSFSAGPAQCRRSIVRIYRHTLVGEGSGQARDAADCIGACVACVSTPLSTSRRALLQRACDAPKRSPVRRTRGTCMARPRIELRRPTRCLKNCLHPIIGLHTCRCQSMSGARVRDGDVLFQPYQTPRNQTPLMGAFQNVSLCMPPIPPLVRPLLN